MTYLTPGAKEYEYKKIQFITLLLLVFLLYTSQHARHNNGVLLFAEDQRRRNTSNGENRVLLFAEDQRWRKALTPGPFQETRLGRSQFNLLIVSIKIDFALLKLLESILKGIFQRGSSSFLSNLYKFNMVSFS